MYHVVFFHMLRQYSLTRYALVWKSQIINSAGQNEIYTSSCFTVSLMKLNEHCHDKSTVLHHINIPYYYALYGHLNDQHSNSGVLFSRTEKYKT